MGIAADSLRSMYLAAAASMLTTILQPASAQWLNYPTAGVPRTADGSPDLTAAAPKAADGKPDLSGLWSMRCPSPGGTVFCAPEIAVPRVFGDIGRGRQGRPPLSTLGGRPGESTPGGKRERRSHLTLPAWRCCQTSHESASAEDRAGSRTASVSD